MEFFLKRLGLFISPILVSIVWVQLSDPFKVFYAYENYFEDYSVSLNAEMVCLTYFKKGKTDNKYDSFIFGSSRSNAFLTKDWKNHIGNESSPFHFFSSSESLFGLFHKIKFLDSIGSNISNTLIVLDEEMLNQLEPKTGHLFINHPELTGESKIKYYQAFIEAALNPKFILSFLDYSVFGIHRNYMGWYISKFEPKVDPKTMDIEYLTYINGITSDSLSFYSDLINKGGFVRKPVSPKERESEFFPKDVYPLLKEIRSIFDKHNSNVKVVVSPLFDQVQISRSKLSALQSIFGEENVFDFSGINSFTSEIGNYYESSHYKPYVARQIMNSVYREKE